MHGRGNLNFKAAIGKHYKPIRAVPTAPGPKGIVVADDSIPFPARVPGCWLHLGRFLNRRACSVGFRVHSGFKGCRARVPKFPGFMESPVSAPASVAPLRPRLSDPKQCTGTPTP